MPVLDRVNMSQFDEDGYVVVEDVLDVDADIQRIVDEYTALLDSLTERWCAEGRLTDTYAELPLVERLTRILQSGVNYGRHFNIALPQTKITEETPIHLGPAVFKMLTHPRLLDAAEEIIGPEMYCHPIHNIRLKPPERFIPTELHDNGMVTATPWHQDQGVILAEADQSQILTVWLAITDATAENGCLSVVPGSHRNDLIAHCLSSTDGLHIAPKYVPADRAIPVPVKRGGMLLMNSKTMHSARPNQSDTLRWSFDLRYSPIGHATGRPAFPGFVARSRQHPETELRDWTVWRDLWLETRTRLAAESAVRKFNRWDLDGPGCA